MAVNQPIEASTHPSEKPARITKSLPSNESDAARTVTAATPNNAPDAIPIGAVRSNS